MADHQTSIEKKIENIKVTFSALSSEEKIQNLMDQGRLLTPYPCEQKIAACLVAGCQSILYLSSRFEEGRVFFDACSDALISAGLAALLISVYSGETPETILNTQPNFLIDLGILSSLTASRSNGLAHIHRRMKNDALKFLLLTMKSIEVNSTSL
jgi:cysteine desulfuration protein SufE